MQIQNSLRLQMNPAFKIAGLLYDRIVEMKMYDIIPTCERLGLDISVANTSYNSKRILTDSIISSASAEHLMRAAEDWIERCDDPELTELVHQLKHPWLSHAGIKNIIFASNGPKPDIRIQNALENTIEIVKNEEYCLVYDATIPHEGLTIEVFRKWWTGKGFTENPSSRLKASLPDNSPGEMAIFDFYYQNLRRRYKDRLPVLLPQVHLHYDPKTIQQRVREGSDYLTLQRIDFLLLFPKGVKIILEVDGAHHYGIDSSGNGIVDKVSPQRYARMVTEDRDLKLAGYEVYRFGGSEFNQRDSGSTINSMLNSFFDSLFLRHKLVLE